MISYKKEGTISWLFGYHNLIHSICVYIAWIKLYRKIPNLMETFCILIHDIGYIQLNYAKDKSNKGHEILGAEIANFFFGKEAYYLVKNHRTFGEKLEVPDEYSHQIIPVSVLKCMWLIEGKKFLRVEDWKLRCKQRWEDRMKGHVLEGQFRDGMKE